MSPRIERQGTDNRRSLPPFGKFRARLERRKRQGNKRATSWPDASYRLIEAINPGSRELAKSMTWYGFWVAEQITSLRPCLVNLIPDYDNDDNDLWQPQFLNLWDRIALHLRTNTDTRIDTIIDLLIKDEIFQLDQERKNLFQARQVVFSVIGWQTMIWKAETGVCPPGQLAISDERNGFQGENELSFRQDQSCCKRSLQQVIMGFGILLPSSPQCRLELRRESQATEGTTAALSSSPNYNCLPTISPASLNMFMLSTVGGIRIQWTDVLSHHLELNNKDRIIYLYRFPSFCLLNVPATSDEESKTERHTPIYACCDSTVNNKYWAGQDDIRDLLRETLLSYRVLFGQDKRSRKMYKRLRPFGDCSKREQDVLLNELCSREHCDLTANEDRDNYDPCEDFPLYSNRFKVLHQVLMNTKARTWKQLWKDKRDSAAWLTFWLLLIFGGLGVMFSFMQMILQVIAISLDRG
ncbi:hypothetical protein PV10_00495 [Exophiala mesophila]|uniref:Uncharacterized protein n=1 Tax=Exophiala mesophila TaxID=212818 RepID=A0A0D1ZPW9_EXOME|nr:uncharacterized protein PV10_00495 [Exophiala mesophila]KIV96657.1 hypothetical protein PV10_00495 [Exophiala mesophila]